MPLPVIDSYSEANSNDLSTQLRPGFISEYGQSFTGNGYEIHKVRFYIQKTGSPTGTVSARIYAHSGTFGVNGVPTGSHLAESATINCSSIAAGPALVEFTFATKYKTIKGTKYFAICNGASVVGDASNTPKVGGDTSSPGHAGNWAGKSGGSWLASDASTDVCFYVYGDATSDGFLAFF